MSDEKDYESIPGRVYFSGVAMPQDEYSKLLAENKELRSILQEVINYYPLNTNEAFELRERYEKLLGDVK